jgi:hypothetical protein
MVCSYCHYPIIEGARYCEHCGAKVRENNHPIQKQRKTMFPLALVILFNFLLDWGSFFFAIMVIRHLVSYTDLMIKEANNLILLLGIFGKVILYVLYMKTFEAKKPEKIIFSVVIVLAVIMPLVNQIFITSHLHFGSNPYLLFNRINQIYIILSYVFLIIFFGFRLKRNHFLWLLIIGYLLYIISGFTSARFFDFLMRSQFSYNNANILLRLYSYFGSFFFLIFGIAMLFTKDHSSGHVSHSLA